MIEWFNNIFKKHKTTKSSKQSDKTTGIAISTPVLIAVGLIGIILMLAGSNYFTKNGNDAVPTVSTSEGSLNSDYAETDMGYVNTLENQLENVLNQIRGVGPVSVLITLESGQKEIYATTVTEDIEKIEEKDSSGGIRSTQRTRKTEEPVITRPLGGAGEGLVLVGSDPPQVKGVLIVAKGAGTAEIKLEIAKAVSSYLGVALYRVAVVEKEV